MTIKAIIAGRGRQQHLINVTYSFSCKAVNNVELSPGDCAVDRTARSSYDHNKIEFFLAKMDLN